ncbi:exodeoxyribonuclease VII large subunit [Lichenihabitans sp. PAMC28606]|nr:exodeoxyribonuclease VII large subunit [Lichenihabitans sp. PAMC28606]UDL94826.1 exodeoxyribonuclease VII large subunit [Lichenihabitans sp. PAMC28606]
MLKPKSSRRPSGALAAAPGLPMVDDDGVVRATANPNDQEMTVSALAGALKRTVEDRFGYVRVRGEISNYRGPHSSGHAYFSLKDDAARIDAVIWKTSFARMKIKPEEGLEVIASGKITTFPGKSAYQIIIESLEPAGVGALMAAVEERRRRFAAEGLFDAARKRPIPFLPGVIGVITSPTGAVIRDILHRIAGRFPRHVVVWPVRVQGDTSAAEVARAVAGFNDLRVAGIPAPHVIIVARGGGSLEDLWSFNDEAIVRAVAASTIPIISAVGHETDWTLIDHVADLRAPTPTGAAELAVPVLLDLMGAIDRLEGRQTAAMLRLLEDRRLSLHGLSRLLPSGGDLLAGPRQRLDLAASRLPGGLRAGTDRRRILLVRIGGRLAAQAPRARVARVAQHLDALAHRMMRAEAGLLGDRQRRLKTAGDRLAAAFAARLRLAREVASARQTRVSGLDARMRLAMVAASQRRTARLASVSQLLTGLGYRSVLARGFVLVRDAAGQTMRSASALAPTDLILLEFADGQARAQVIDTDVVEAAADPAVPSSSARRTKAGPKSSATSVPKATTKLPRTPLSTKQGSLF